MFVRIRQRAPSGPTRHLAALVQEADGHERLIPGQYLEGSASEAVQKASEQEEAFRMPIGRLGMIPIKTGEEKVLGVASPNQAPHGNLGTSAKMPNP
jgi:hypothetical protein